MFSIQRYRFFALCICLPFPFYFYNILSFFLQVCEIQSDSRCFGLSTMGCYIQGEKPNLSVDDIPLYLNRWFKCAINKWRNFKATNSYWLYLYLSIMHIKWQGSGKKEVVRYLLWVRLYRVRKVNAFFHRLEQNIQINYLFTRIVKLISVELYCTHTAACIFYYLATTLPPTKESLTWIGSLTLGGYGYQNFREIELGRRYVVSLYFAIVTMATVGKSVLLTPPTYYVCMEGHCFYMTLGCDGDSFLCIEIFLYVGQSSLGYDPVAKSLYTNLIWFTVNTNSLNLVSRLCDLWVTIK